MNQPIKDLITELYHLVLVDPDSKVLARLSFEFTADKEFYIRDEVADICEPLFNLLFSNRSYQIYAWTRDLSLHQLTYYGKYTKEECRRDKEGCRGCYVCEEYEDEICTAYFFTDAYVSDWYFQEHYAFLKMQGDKQ